MLMYKDFDEMMSCGKCGNTGTNPRACKMGAYSGKGGCKTGCNGAKGVDNGCHRRTWGLVDYPLAMVYAPLQSFDNVFDKHVALEKGTMFEGLDLPFEGQSVYKGGCCRG